MKRLGDGTKIRRCIWAPNDSKPKISGMELIPEARGDGRELPSYMRHRSSGGGGEDSQGAAGRGGVGGGKRMQRMRPEDARRGVRGGKEATVESTRRGRR